MAKIKLNVAEREKFYFDTNSTKVAESFIAPKRLVTLYQGSLDGKDTFAVEAITSEAPVPERLIETGQQSDFIRLTQPTSIDVYSSYAEAFKAYVANIT